MNVQHIAILASGSGSNARKILEYFEDRNDVEVSIIITNKKNAGVLNHAKEFAVSTLRIDRSYFNNNDCILKVLRAEKIDLIVLAGFLWLIPPYLISEFPNKILNIHPGLLPKYGGKGMYGQHVHEAVKANNETESGLTIHYVNEKFDEGEHIFQAKCKVLPSDSTNEIAANVLKLEHKHYAEVIDSVLKEL
ncbi:MAG: phosphoribosylglycinamide formyltransferase-1 [Saprospiraceae bacterium]